MKLRKKKAPVVEPPIIDRRASEPPLIPHAPPPSRRDTTPNIDLQTGERLYSFDSETSTLCGDARPYDVTELMHSLMRDLSSEDLHQAYLQSSNRPPGEASIASLPSSLWALIASHLSLADTASLGFASTTLAIKLEASKYWKQMNQPENKKDKLDFLFRLDQYMPLHLLCTPCATFHERIQLGRERWKADFVNNPLFVCPKVRDLWLPRTRIASSRVMPFYFVQLATRQKRFSALHGIPASSLDRQWKCPNSQWSHTARFVVVNGHLLMRVMSQCMAPPNFTDTERRMLLLERMDYTPYFSVCAHWKTGELLKVCKCALAHIPRAPERIRDQLKEGRGPSLSARNREFVVVQCQVCRDIRRCPRCPTEYLVQIKMVEARGPTGRPTFKHAITVTRWSDLGNGSSPLLSPEWAACEGEDPEGLGKFDSLKEVGKRTVSGQFEAETNNHLFLKRVISLDPMMGKRWVTGTKDEEKKEDEEEW